MDARIDVRPIGVVESGPPGSGLSLVRIFPEYSEALDGVASMDRLWVIYWMDRITEAERAALRVRPKHDGGRGLSGAFALRTPARPNPFGLTCVELAACDGPVLTVRGLDALPGSPVLDIKPFRPPGDCGHGRDRSSGHDGKPDSAASAGQRPGLAQDPGLASDPAHGG